MDISKELPQFTDEKALLVVTSKQDGLFYIATSGRIERVEEFHLPRITHPDSAGSIKERGFDTLLSSGYVRENKKRNLRYKFLNEVESRLKEINRREAPTTVYIFCPAYVMQAVRGVIPYPLREKVVKTYAGEYHQRHPFKILEKIKESKESGPIPVMKEAAQKILEKAKQARAVIGKRHRHG